MTKPSNYQRGLRAEQLAAWWLRLKGYRVLGQRVRVGGGEIDVLARRGGVLVVVEVKARASLAACHETVTPWKQQRLARAAEAVLAGHGKFAGLAAGDIDTIRFDVVWVAPRHWPRHIKDAWR
jgi:putative endonuclease